MHNQHGHAHCSCVHCLHFCQICKVVYCCKCGEQWYQGWGYYYNYPTFTTPCGTLGNGGSTTLTITSCCNHLHASST